MKPRVFGEDPGLRLIALVVAVLLWFVAQGEQVQRTSTVAQVEWLLPNDLVLISDDPLPDRVVLMVSGAQMAARRVANADLRYTVDLREAASGRTLHAFRGPPTGLPDGLHVETVSPAMVELAFDEPLSRTLPVRLVTRGSLPPGWKEVRRTVRPETVTVLGARSELASLDNFHTRALDLSERQGSWTGRVALDHSALHLGEGAPAEVEVHLELDEIPGERRVSAVVEQGEGAMVEVRIEGPLPLLDALEPRQFLWEEVPSRLAAEHWALLRPSEEAAGLPALRLRIDHPRAADIRVRAFEPSVVRRAPAGATKKENRP